MRTRTWKFSVHYKPRTLAGHLYGLPVAVSCCVLHVRVVLGAWKSIFETFEGEDLRVEGEVSRTLQVRLNGSQCKGPTKIANLGDFVCVYPVMFGLSFHIILSPK